MDKIIASISLALLLLTGCPKEEPTPAGKDRAAEKVERPAGEPVAKTTRTLEAWVVALGSASETDRSEAVRALQARRTAEFETLLSAWKTATGPIRKGLERVLQIDKLREADVVSLHAPLLASTRGMIDARRLSLMRDGATLVNTARGAIVEGAALERELVSGRMSAVLDTTDPEQLPADSPLYQLPNVFLTPHVAGALGAETERLVECGLDELERYVRGEPLQHGIAREDLERLA